MTRRMHERRAYVCFTKEGVLHQRVFLMPGDPEPPKCPTHGKMLRQTNLSYMKPRKGRHA